MVNYIKMSVELGYQDSLVNLNALFEVIYFWMSDITLSLDPLPLSHFVTFRLDPSPSHNPNSNKLWTENHSKQDANFRSNIL